MASDTLSPFSFQKKLQSFLINILLLFSGSFFFALSNPGFIFSKGISFLAWFAYIPVFILVYRTSFKTVWIYGFFYGVISYMLYVSWLVIFTPVGSIAIEAQYGVMLMLVFIFMKLSFVLFPKKGWLSAFIVCLAYEYLKTTGFAGFSYGVTAYTQWQNLILMQCADIAGVWPLSALVVFTSAWLSIVLIDFIKSEKHTVSGFVFFAFSHKISGLIWLVCFTFCIVYGFFSQKDYSKYPEVQVAAIQHNTDPWIGGIKSYVKDVETLIELSNQAKFQAPETQLIVWPETSVVPSIMRHYYQRKDRSRFELIKNFLEYVEHQDAVFVVGNDHSVDISGGDTADYNSVMVFTPKKDTLPPEPAIYSKIHLVPFTESFPWPDQFPGMYQALLNGDTHLWSKGSEYVVFHAAGLSFSTPICFEDTFGETCRQMFNAGARALVNLSNDAWSRSISCQNQHLAMARFRCIENRIPAVRSTASGQTCIIDPNGVIKIMAEPFTKSFVTGSIPVIPEDAPATVYARIGDIIGQFFAAAACIIIIFGIIKNCIHRMRRIK